MLKSVRSHFAGLTPNTFLLAFASLFGDISSEMLYPVLPIFLTQSLGASPTIVGLVEGVAPALQNIVQGFSGGLADRLGRRKPLALAGYLLGALAKPLIGLAAAWPAVLAARSLDRLGSGIRSAPRDALVAASADDMHRGKAFGLEGIGDNFGAFLGPLVAIALLHFVETELRTIFYATLIPGLLAVLMLLFVRERPVAKSESATFAPSVRQLPRDYWRYLFVTAVFGIGNSTNSFLILRTQDLGAPLALTIFIYALFNLVAALASYPAGYLSDVLGRRGVLLVSFLFFLVVYAGFGLATHFLVCGALFLLYGFYQGAFRAVGKAFATDLAPAELRASGIGWYSATVGFTGLVASVVGGELWTRVSPAATFYFGAASALLGSGALVTLVPRFPASRGVS